MYDQYHRSKTILEKRKVLAVSFRILRTLRKFHGYLINSSKYTGPANKALLAKFKCAASECQSQETGQ